MPARERELGELPNVSGSNYNKVEAPSDIQLRLGVVHFEL
jgi:hypothetical protein